MRRKGSKWLGAEISPASAADSESVSFDASTAEVGACGRLRSVGSLAEVHGVEVLRQDLLLRVPVLQLPREDRLVELPAKGVRIAHVELLHELLRDGRPTLDHVPALHVLDGRTKDRLQIDAVMAVEAAVLDRDGGVAERLGDLRAGEHDAVLGRVQLGDQRSVRRVEEGRLRQRTGREVVEVRQAAAGRHGGEQRQRARAVPGLFASPGKRTPGPAVLRGATGSIAAPCAPMRSPC